MPNAVLKNHEVAALLREMGERLQRSGESPFRVTAYLRAATVIAKSSQDVAQILEADGEAGLQQLRGIGKSLARTTARLVRRGSCSRLERLRRQGEGTPLLCSLPGVGTKLADRIQRALGATAFEEVFTAACDGRLRRVPGLGAKRIRSIRESLATRLQVGQSLPRLTTLNEPPIEDLLSIDDEYRQKGAAGRLPLASPRLFNPSGTRWLPILESQRGNRSFTAHFANTARSHQLGRFRDWVVITCETKEAFGQWTVITATRGSMRGKRIVMHREQDCLRFYEDLRLQLPLPFDNASS